MGKHSLILFIICSLFSFFSLAQSEKTDSIKAAITQLPEDSTKVNALLDLSSAVFRSKPDTAIIYAEQARDLAAKIQFQKGLGYALKNIGLAYYIKSDFVAVLDYWHQSLEIFIAMDDKLGISNLNNNIGAVHFNYGDDPKALEYYLESLQAAEQLGDKVRMATALTNIGAIYFKNPVTHDKAFDYYKRAMDISEETGNLDAIGTSAVNLGEYYLEEKQYQSALNMFEKALPAMEETGGNTSYVLMNMGKVFALQDSLDQAVRFHQAAIQSGEEKNAKFQTLQALIGLASTYKQKGDYQESLNNYLKAETIAQEEGWNVELKDAYGGLSKAYADLSDYNNAYKYQVLFNNIRDTLNNIESERRMANIQFRFDLEKKEAEIALLKKDRELNQATIKQANILRNFLFAITGLLVIIMGGIYYQYRFAQKTNKVIRKERNRAEEILLNILPYDTAQELKEKGYVQAKRFEQTTVLFTDFKEFTKIAESNSPENLVKSIDYYFTHFDEIISRHKLEKIKTIGDAYMCAGGLPVPNQSNPIDAVKAAIEIANFVQSVKINPPEGILPFDVRIGINTGPVVAGVVGTKKFQYDIWGSTVNVAARMESSSDSGKINVSENIYRLIKDEFECEYRGEIAAKNGEEFKMYYVNASVN